MKQLLEACDLKYTCLEPHAGASLYRCKIEAASFSIINNVVVEFTFNGLHYMVDPADIIAVVVVKEVK